MILRQAHTHTHEFKKKVKNKQRQEKWFSTTSLTEDLSLAPSTCVVWLTTACKSSLRRSSASGTYGHLHPRAHTHTHFLQSYFCWEKELEKSLEEYIPKCLPWLSLGIEFTGNFIIFYLHFPWVLWNSFIYKQQEEGLKECLELKVSFGRIAKPPWGGLWQEHAQPQGSSAAYRGCSPWVWYLCYTLTRVLWPDPSVPVHGGTLRGETVCTANDWGAEESVYSVKYKVNAFSSTFLCPHPYEVKEDSKH